VARVVVGSRKPRKLTKPLKSTLKDVRERFRQVAGEVPPEEVIHEIALSEDQDMENWKAGLILVVDEPSKSKAESEAKKMVRALGGADQRKRRVPKKKSR
jgi:hypothetical protein